MGRDFVIDAYAKREADLKPESRCQPIRYRTQQYDSRYDAFESLEGPELNEIDYKGLTLKLEGTEAIQCLFRAGDRMIYAPSLCNKGLSMFLITSPSSGRWNLGRCLDPPYGGPLSRH